MRDIWRHVVLDVTPEGCVVIRASSNEPYKLFTAGEPIEAKVLVYKSGRRRRSDCRFLFTGRDWGFSLTLKQALKQGIGWKDREKLMYWSDPIWEDEEIRAARLQTS